MRTLLALILICSTAAAVDYPVVFVESPLAANNDALPEAFRPWPDVPGKLVLLHPNGTRETLVDPGANGAAFDPMVSLDGQWIFYAQIPDVTVRPPTLYPPRPQGGSDVWRINVATHEKQKLTDQTPAPYGGRTRSANHGVFNMGPCPVAGGRVIFTSDREIPGQQQLWSMDLDGANVEKVGHLNLAGVLHPVRLSNGRIIWSTLESQGLRTPLNWGLWTTTPDGRDFEPYFSAFLNGTSIHFQAEAANRHVVTTEYYRESNEGFGHFRAAPLVGGFEHRTTGQADHRIFARTGEYMLTPWTHDQDLAAPLGPDGINRVGKVTHPATAPPSPFPGGPTYILCTYSAGPVNRLERPTNLPPIQAGIYLCPVGSPTAGPGDLVLVADDPTKHESQPQAVVPYATLFGSDPPAEPWLPNAGTPHLPAGTPYALIGTSSNYVRETNTLVGRLDLQGGNLQPFANSQISKIRILTLEMPTHETPWLNLLTTKLTGNERMRILGEVDLKRFDANGNRILDPAGNPDTSFLAKVRADEAFTFQLVDDAGRSLTTAMTWHHVRPGEVKHDCQGCHAHTIPETRFDFPDSWAGQHDPADFTASKPRLIEYIRDVKPILDGHGCTGCHTQGTDGAPVFDFQTSRFTVLDSLHSAVIDRVTTADLTKRMPRTGEPLTAAEIRTLAEWIDTGSLVDTGEAFRDDTKPTLFIHSPRSLTSAGETIVVSAADAEFASLTATLNGNPVTLTTAGGGIWTGPAIEADGELIATATDTQGNQSRQVRKFKIGTAPPPPPPPVPDELTKLRAFRDAVKAALQILEGP